MHSYLYILTCYLRTLYCVDTIQHLVHSTLNMIPCNRKLNIRGKYSANRYSKNVHIDLLLLPIYGIIYACLLHTFFVQFLNIFLQIEKTHHESQSVTVTTTNWEYKNEREKLLFFMGNSFFVCVYIYICFEDIRWEIYIFDMIFHNVYHICW